MPEASGDLTADGESLIYTSPSDGWSLGIGSLRLVAEYTNENGPFADDCFIILFDDAHSYEFPFTTPNWEVLKGVLAEKRGWYIKSALTFSTTFDSRILAPPDYEGKPLFQYENRRASLTERIASAFLINELVNSYLTDDAMRILGKR